MAGSKRRRCGAAGSSRARVIGPALAFLLSLSAGSASASDALTELQTRAFAQVCAQCHVVPGLGAPILGDSVEWEARNQKGFDELVRNTVVGLGNMPPLGTCGFCTEADFRALVAFLSGLSADDRPESGR